MLTFSTPLEIRNQFERHMTFKWEAGSSDLKSRRKLLKELEKQLLHDREKIQNALNHDLGKASLETDYTELYVVLSELRHCIKHLERWMEGRFVSSPLNLFGTRGRIIQESKGVVLVVSPSNFPLNLSLNPLIHAVAAGNCVVLKPSEQTPATASYLAGLCEKAFSADLVSVVQGGAEESKELLKLPFNHIHYTGGPEIGKIYMRAAAEHLASVTLELGGKSPAVVDRTAKLKHAAERIAWARFFNSGQTCIAVDHVLVERVVFDAFIEELKLAVVKLYGRPPYDENPDYARMAHASAFEKQRTLLADAVTKGANVIVGGELDAQKKFVAPTILTDVTMEMDIMKEEIFGPLLPVIAIEDLDEAIKVMRGFDTPLALYHFSGSKKYQRKVIRETRAGTGGINESVIQFFHPELPFGGMGKSGVGRTSGKYGFDSFSNQRSVIEKTGFKDVISLALPPYSGIKRKIASLMIRWF